MEERSVHLLDYVAVLKRRRWWLIVPIVLGPLAGLALIQVLPRQYTAATTLVATGPTMTSDVVKTSPVDRDDRIRAISQELLSRSVLERVAREEGLEPGPEMDWAIAGMRDGTTVTLPKPLASTGRSGPDTFLLTYVGRTPADAQRITNRLARAFIDQHSKMRETRAEHTSDFLAAQLGQSRDRLKAIEERLRQVKETYMGRLPEQTQGNLQMVGGLRQQQENTSMSLRSDEDRLAMIERQIEAMKGGTVDTGTTVGTVSSSQQRIAALRKELDAASATYHGKAPRGSAAEERARRRGGYGQSGRIGAGVVAGTRARGRSCVSTASRGARDRAPPHPRPGACCRSGRRRNRRVPTTCRCRSHGRAANELAHPRIRPGETALQQPVGAPAAGRTSRRISNAAKPAASSRSSIRPDCRRCPAHRIFSESCSSLRSWALPPA